MFGVIRGIYPSTLEIKLSEALPRGVFMDIDMEVLYTKRKHPFVKTAVYDKREHELKHWPQAKYYVHAHSNVPVEFKLNVLVSQSIRFSRLCTYVDDFANRMAACYVSLLRDSHLDEASLRWVLRK